MKRLRYYAGSFLLGAGCVLSSGCVTAHTESHCYGADRQAMSRRGMITTRDIQQADFVRSALPEIFGACSRSVIVKPQSRYVQVELFKDIGKREAEDYGKKIEEFRARHPDVYPMKLIVTILPEEGA